MSARRPISVAILLLLLAACDSSVLGDDENGAGTVDPARTALTDEELYDEHCSLCHDDATTTKAPRLAAMSAMGVSSVAFALNNGIMRSQAEGLSVTERLRIALYVAGSGEAYQPDPGAFCAEPAIELDPLYVTRWGLDANNSAAHRLDATHVRSTNIGSLELKWVFGLPETANARSQPAIAGDTLFVAAAGGHLFALDRYRGCMKWHHASNVPLRTALTLGTLQDAGEERAVLFFGDVESHIHAVDALSGKRVWRTDVGVADQSVATGAPIPHEGALIVPVSLYEVASARDPSFECCKAHGAVHRLDASTGKIVWTLHLTPDAVLQGKTDVGLPRWGPSGVPVWSTPTIDEKRGVLYVGTGQNASAPATELSDSVLAIDLASGEIVWRFQALAGDVYNDACSQFPKGPNCPEFNGPDFDFGASILLVRNTQGNDVLVAGQKSGDVYALDPDEGGQLLWRRRVGGGSALGGVHWGMAFAEGKVFVPVSDPPFPIPGYLPRPGMVALAIDDGRVQWEQRVERGCETTMTDYFLRGALYPDCSFYFGLSAAAAVVGDVVFAGALDGRLRAFSLDSGAEVWRFDTARSFETVNGVAGHGGAIDNPGVQAAGHMIYVQSGYGLFGQLPGNVLLAFGLASD